MRYGRCRIMKIQPEFYCNPLPSAPCGALRWTGSTEGREVEVRKCKTCGLIRPINHFWLRELGYRRKSCNVCCRENDKKRAGRKKVRVSCDKKERARRALRRAVKSGKVYKPARCSRCFVLEEGRKIQGHHYKGYDAPLDVIWLCNLCHSIEEGRSPHPVQL